MMEDECPVLDFLQHLHAVRDGAKTEGETKKEDFFIV